MLNKLKKLLIFLFSQAALCVLYAQENGPSQIQFIKTENAPLIESIEVKDKDILYQQYSMDLQQFYMDLAANRKTATMFYSYKPKKEDTIFTIAARFNIPAETIACINGLAAVDYVIAGKTLLIPAAPGLFVLDAGRVRIEKPANSLEALIQKKYMEKLDDRSFFCYNINERYFIHLPDEKLDATARSFFLDVKMKTPLDQYWLSSDYGYRPSPFNGEKQFHRGIDMAAPEGTKVYACKGGKVISVVKMDPTFGNYIVIKHPSGLSSIYAHLSKIEVKNGENVTTGQEIGLVGKTGRVTGPHLHFEIRQNGQSTNPNAYIRH